MAESTHKVEVVPLKMEPHPNADSLSIVRVWGYTCVVKTADWQGHEMAAYIPPDSLVPNSPDYAWLNGHLRIRVHRFRGILSQGLLMPAPPGSKIGDDVAAKMGITHYNPPEPQQKQRKKTKKDLRFWKWAFWHPIKAFRVFMMERQPMTITPPEGYHPIYDLETYYRYPDVFKEGEEVIVTEKLHGMSSRYVFSKGKFYSGSHRQWKREDPDSPWWKIHETHPWIREYCEENPDRTLYGEIFGDVQDLKYGAKTGELLFRAFDVLEGNTWYNWDEFDFESPPEQMVPLVYQGPYSDDIVRSLVDGPSLVPGAKNIREGIVVKPIEERTHPKVGRVALKVVSPKYLERAK